MFNYNVYTPPRMPHEYPHTDWHNNIHRHTVDFGNLTLFTYTEDGEQEYPKAVYPNGCWVKLDVRDPVAEQNRFAGDVGMNHQAARQAIPNGL